MAKGRISVAMQKQIQELCAQGVSIRRISRALNVSRQTVRRFMRMEVTARVAQPIASSEKGALLPWYETLDWEHLGKLSKQGVTVKQLHKEHADAIGYDAFWRMFRKRTIAEKAVCLRIEHIPGERVEVDYTDGIGITDRATGEIRKTHLFCGVLPFSGFVYGEFVFNQKLDSFVRSHDRMFGYFGGVAPYVVVDNLKSGVTKAHRYDPDVNPTYCEYGNHMGFAVLPARPYKPKDKATVEANIGAIQRGFYQEVRETTFYELSELNEAFRIYLEQFNHRVMKDYGVSRWERFQTEGPLLKPIPALRYEIREHRLCKVHPDCHVQVEKNYYSVPHRHVGETVRVRMTSKVLEIQDNSLSVIAVHTRLNGVGKFSTTSSHYPDKKLGIKRFELKQAEVMAKEIGPKTATLVCFLISNEYPLKHLRRIQGILRLHQTKHVNTEALEYGCEQALRFQKPRLAYVKACAEHYQAHGSRLVLVRPERREGSAYLHANQGGEAL